MKPTKNNLAVILLLLFLPLSPLAQYADHHKMETSSTDPELQHFDKLLCRAGDQLISVEGTTDEIEINSFTEDGKLLNTFECAKIKEFKNLKFYSAKEVDDKVVVYFMAENSSTSKGKTGLFSAVFSPTTSSFENATLIDEFEMSLSPRVALIVQSENKAYTAFLIAPETNSANYKYNLLVLNAAGEKVTTVYNAEGSFDEFHQFSEVNLTNDGDVYLTYREHAEFTNFGQPFLDVTNRMVWIKHPAGGQPKTTYFKDPARHFLQFRLIPLETAPAYFFSWCMADDHSNVGISWLDPETLAETVIYEFDPQVLEPFVERNGTNDRFHDDSLEQNVMATNVTNAYIDLVNQFQYEGHTYMLLEKRTPARIRVVRGESTVSVYLDIEGDLFLLDCTNKEIQKIERSVTRLSTPRGVCSMFDGKTLHCFYYSLPAGEEANVPIDRAPESFLTGNLRPEDMHLYRTEFDLSNETTSQVELNPAIDSSNYLTLSMNKAFFDGGYFWAAGHFKKLKQAARISVVE